MHLPQQTEQVRQFAFQRKDIFYLIQLRQVNLLHLAFLNLLVLTAIATSIKKLGQIIVIIFVTRDSKPLMYFDLDHDRSFILSLPELMLNMTV